MDSVTRYYFAKANLKAADEYHDHIQYTDIDNLRKAAAYLLIAPVGTFLFVHFLKTVQEDGGVSKHFRAWAGGARAWTNTSSTAGATWDGADAEYKY